MCAVKSGVKMNRALLLSPGYFSSCSSESDNESSSDSDEPTAASTDAADGAALAAAQCRKKPRNFIAKLLNREVSFGWEN